MSEETDVSIQDTEGHRYEIQDVLELVLAQCLTHLFWLPLSLFIHTTYTAKIHMQLLTFPLPNDCPMKF